jgi:hypothetical protein
VQFLGGKGGGAGEFAGGDDRVAAGVPSGAPSNDDFSGDAGGGADDDLPF